jgi:hypothetical protein
MSRINKKLNPNIKDFKLDKRTGKLINEGYFEHKNSPMYLNSLASGHLWISKLVLDNGYSKVLYELILYAEENKTNLFEWTLSKKQVDDISDILNRYNLKFEKLIVNGFEPSKYKVEFKHLHTKNDPINALSRLIHLACIGHAKLLMKFVEGDSIETLLKEYYTVINATYIGNIMVGDYEKKIIKDMPADIVNILMEESLCEVEHKNLKYYPKNAGHLQYFSEIVDYFSKNWSNYNDTQQTIIGKFIYSIKVVMEMNISLLAVNGILAAVSTRILFDNYWQSKYIIDNGKIDEYREFCLDRMRLHILKRTGKADIKDLDILEVAVENDLLAPIPVMGDYFKKSAREYSIELGIKDSYDKYYEYNSEFIHASLTAVYSAIMDECSNPEHDFHLTITPHASNYTSSLPHIIEIINMHMELINNYFSEEVFSKLNLSDIAFDNRDDFVKYMKKQGILLKE